MFNRVFTIILSVLFLGYAHLFNFPYLKWIVSFLFVYNLINLYLDPILKFYRIVYVFYFLALFPVLYYAFSKFLELHPVSKQVTAYVFGFFSFSLLFILLFKAVLRVEIKSVKINVDLGVFFYPLVFLFELLNSFLGYVKQRLGVAQTETSYKPEERQVYRTIPSELNLLETLVKCENIFLIGKKGSGKTSLLERLLEEKLNAKPSSKIFIIDPHSRKDQWNYPTYGLGKNYEQILEKIDEVLNIVKSRYYALSQNSDNLVFDPIVLVIDEMTEVTEYLDINSKIRELLNCRKVNVSLVIGGHSDNADDMGLKGHYNLIKNFDAIVKLDYNHFSGVRKYLLDLSPEGKSRNYVEVNYSNSLTTKNETYKYIQDHNIEQPKFYEESVKNYFTSDEINRVKSLLLDGKTTVTKIVDEIPKNRQRSFQLVEELKKELEIKG